jgi:hypothetical protein
VTATTYKKALRSAVYELWKGRIDVIGFIDTMFSTVYREFTVAWAEGAKECGIIAPRELTGTEIQALNAEIAKDAGHIITFANDIMIGSQANGGKLKPLYARTNLWANRYNSVRNHARFLACSNQKMIWEMGGTEKHCRTCNALDGKVKRNDIWVKSGVRPQNAPNALLECRGWNCDCSLKPTDLPVTPGRLPHLP